MAKNLPDIEPTHPGETLKEDFMDELGLTCYGVAKACGIPRTRIERVYRGERPITADTALRLERCLGVSAKFWLGLQAQYDIDVARLALGDKLDDVEQLNEPVVVEPAARKRKTKVSRAINELESIARATGPYVIGAEGAKLPKVSTTKETAIRIPYADELPKPKKKKTVGVSKKQKPRQQPGKGAI